MCPKPGLLVVLTANNYWLIFTQVLTQQSTVNLCQFCDKICRFAAGLRRYMSVHGVNVSNKDKSFPCYMAGLTRVKLIYGVTCMPSDVCGIEMIDFFSGGSHYICVFQISTFTQCQNKLHYK